jgi:hypothetical protein
VTLAPTAALPAAVAAIVIVIAVVGQVHVLIPGLLLAAGVPAIAGTPFAVALTSSPYL